MRITNRPKRTLVQSLTKKLKLAVPLLLIGVLVAGLGLSRVQAATPSFVQAKANEIRTGTTNSITFNSSNAAGNLIVVYLLWNNTAGVAVTDSLGNTYTNATSRTTWGSNWSSQTFYAKNIQAGTNTVTATFATPINSFGISYIHEYSGIDKVNPVDGVSSAFGTTSAMSSGQVTTTAANALLFGGGGSRNTVTAAGAGFTSRLNNYGNRTEDRNVTSAGSYAATATQNSNGWVQELVVFKADDSAPIPDTTAPTAPTNLSATATAANRVSLAWTAATDNVGVTGYKVYRDAAEIATAPGASYVDTTALPGTTYIYAVSAYDAANNISPQSATASVTTPTADTTAPAVAITAPAPSETVSGIVTVTADASDNVAVTKVEFYVDGSLSGVADTSTPYALQWDTRGITNGNHTLTAKAYDAANNVTTSAPVAANVANSSYFQNEILATGFSLPTAMKFLPDGRLLVAELKGRIKVVPPPYTNTSATLFLQIPNLPSAGVYQGIYDIELDPDFATNRYYYVFYTMNSPRHDRLSRFTANADLNGTVDGSEFVLYEDPLDANSEHHGGAIAFANDGKILFTTGDHFSANSSPLLTSPRGKVHRINKDGTVPTDNPFYDGAGPNIDSIYSRGLRNPFRSFYDKPTGKLYIGDVGGNNNATSQEEINVAAPGASFGWPASEGACSAPCVSPLFNYGHNGRDASVTGGFVYRGTQFPAAYQGNYFYADYAQNWIRRLALDANGNVTGSYNFEPINGALDGPYGDIVYLTEGPDGALYYLDLGFSDDSGVYGIAKVRRIRYIETNQAPIAVATATPVSGSIPLDVSFSSNGSSDPEGATVTYHWDFGDGTTSTLQNPAHTYTQSGQYTARLSVSDGTNTTLATPITITVGNAPIGTITTPTDGTTFDGGAVITFSGEGTDTEDGNLPASAFTWNIDFMHEGHIHPVETQTGVKSGSFTIPTDGHDFSSLTRYRIRLTVTDADGLQHGSSVTIWPHKVSLTFDSVPSGRVLYLDGIAKTTPFTYDTLVNFNHTIEARDQSANGTTYTFASWSDGGARIHNLTVPAADQSYTATFTSTSAPTGLVGAWNFNEALGTSILDASGNNNTGTIIGSAASRDTNGKYGSALSFTGTSSGYVTIPTSSSLALTSSHTLEAWIKPTTTTGYQTILIKEATTGCDYWLQLNGSRISGGFKNTSTCVDHLSPTVTLPLNQWSHIAGVFDDTLNTYTLYLNGVAVNTRTETTAPVTSSNPLVFGQSGWAGGNYERWHGAMDDIRVYNRVLTAGEIQNDMNTPL